MKWERTDGLRLNVARASALVLLALSSASQSCGRKHLEEDREYIVGDEKGVWMARSLQRKLLRERWNPGSIELVNFFPFKVPGDPNADEDIPEVMR